MPQIWLTLGEIGDLIGREPAFVEVEIAETGQPQRRCSDGVTRVKLPAGMAHDYMLAYAAASRRESDTDLMVTRLRDSLSLSRRPQPQRDPREELSERARSAFGQQPKGPSRRGGTPQFARAG